MCQIRTHFGKGRQPERHPNRQEGRKQQAASNLPEAGELLRAWSAENQEKFGRKQRSSIDSVNYHAAALPLARLPIGERNGRTLVSVTGLPGAAG
ncbi:MAG: hypothetical protein ACLQOO_14000 [Terriglobia bacterium]